jgi:hypothetical protein
MSHRPATASSTPAAARLHIIALLPAGAAGAPPAGASAARRTPEPGIADASPRTGTPPACGVVLRAAGIVFCDPVPGRDRTPDGGVRRGTPGGGLVRALPGPRTAPRVPLTLEAVRVLAGAFRGGASFSAHAGQYT